MKNILFSLIIIFLVKTISAQAPNQTSPRNTLEEAFKSARTGNFEYIHLLCDPSNRNDGDTKRICSLNTNTPKEQNEFRRFFKLAFSLKEEIINEETARVTFKFGPKAQQLETMRLVKRGNKWYLIGF